MHKEIILGGTLALVLSGCAWNEPARVESDFGKSVRLMIAEQLYDPAVAKEPSLVAPDVLTGSAAQSAINGYQAASQQARLQRSKETDSPLPVVSSVSEVKDD